MEFLSSDSATLYSHLSTFGVGAIIGRTATKVASVLLAIYFFGRMTKDITIAIWKFVCFVRRCFRRAHGVFSRTSKSHDGGDSLSEQP